MPATLDDSPGRFGHAHSDAAGRPRSLSVGADVLALLGVSHAAARLLRYFVLHPEARSHARFLHDEMGLSKASLHRDLSRLVALGALKRVVEGRLVLYAPIPLSKIWRGVRLILTDSTDTASVLRDALAGVPGLDAAFVFGSMATTTDVRPDSDVDLFVVETPAVDRRALHHQLVEAGMLLGREVNAIRYTPQSLAERLGDSGQAGAHFVREVLEGPKRWILGTAEALRPLATAAGIRLVDVPSQDGGRVRDE